MLDGLERKRKTANFFERFSQFASEFAGTTIAFIMAVMLILGWLITGPLFNFSDTWQLVINTTTTIVTFLMVFLIQRTQNKDSRALHLKLNELVASSPASNRLIDIEGLSEQELRVLSTYYRKLSDMAKREANLTASHSIEEAEELHRTKYRRKKQKKFAPVEYRQSGITTEQKEISGEKQKKKPRYRHYRKPKNNPNINTVPKKPEE